MKWTNFLFALCIVSMMMFPCFTFSSETVSLIRIEKPTKELLQLLKREQFDICASSVGKLADLLITPVEKVKLDGMKIKYSVVHENYPEFVAERARSQRVPGQGSMGGFHTFDEVVAFLDALHNNYPAIVSQKFSAGKSLEDRDLWVIKVSDNVEFDENEPEVFYNSLIHAREPQGMECLLYYLEYLVANYGTDAEVTHLINNRELFFLPVVNPDGYVYNETTNPNGGGYWRKNRRGNGSSTWGVDLNRNLGYQWGYDNSGSSPYTSAEDYRGESAFSEPATQVYRDFCNARDFKTGLNYHTYSNLLIRPFGYDDVPLNPPSDITIYDLWGTMMTELNNYDYGDAPSTVGYEVNGGQDDWCYGERNSKPKIFTFSPEIGSFSDGFWPAPNRILPLAQENLEMNLLIAWFAGSYCSLQDMNWQYSDENNNGYPDWNESAELVVTIKNIGIESAQSVQASLVTTHNDVIIENGTFSFGAIDTMAEQTNSSLPFVVHFGSSLFWGEEVNLVISVTDDGTPLYEEEFAMIMGPPMVALRDSGDSLALWDVTGKWGTTTTSSHSAPSSFTESPNGEYDNSSVEILSIHTPLDLTNIHNPVLRFWTKWDIESSWDFAQVQVSPDNGASWTALTGKYTDIGSGNGAQPSGEPGYDGTQVTWVLEEMDLSAYQGKNNVRIRFRFASDSSQTYDGWNVDDIEVLGYPNAGNVPTVSSRVLLIISIILSTIFFYSRKQKHKTNTL